VERFDLLVVGAGIVGLAHALSGAKRGMRVCVVERSSRAIGASVRNFGMVWPIGQPAGPLLRRALRSREIWLQCAEHAPFWHEPCGALHVATDRLEMAVLEEFESLYADRGYRASLLSRKDALATNRALRADRVVGALRTGAELCVDPREAIRELPGYLSRRHNVVFRFGLHASRVNTGSVEFSDDSRIEADRIVVASGPDLRVLFPVQLAAAGIVNCKLQMMRSVAQPDAWRMGTHLAAGLTLIHYKAFAACPSLPALRAASEERWPDHLRLGVHVLVSQNRVGELTIGDSHEYAADLEPFDRDCIDQLVLDYLDEFFHCPRLEIAERWHGIYPKSTLGATEVVLRPLPGVFLVNALGGNGMTLSFGLAEETIDSILHDRDWTPPREVGN